VTHAVCVGMTGSGKTGLCISLLEEAAIDGIPAIAIDPKGDLTNLLLAFPELKAQDFLPWVNEDDAHKKGLTTEEYAAKQAQTWANGLSSWGQSGDRIKRLREAADFVIYTPGSNSGIPVSIVKSFSPPPPAIMGDEELLRERISTTATSLLGIIGISADPIKSREHILISTLLDLAWKGQREFGIAELIQQIQKPPVTKIGVMDIDSFYPAKERFNLALALNNLLAAPGFSSWLEGEPLEMGSILYNPGGKPKISIFSIAHLNDSERMFFVALLLNQILGWMRTQSGTSSLRAIVYMDEIFGFFPPVANPPSKTPLLTLLKQARAFGVGVVLATQNPVDLDYKGLSNTGTWFIGRLQTERDKMRVLEGLEGVAASNEVKWDRQTMEQTLAGLSNRIFLMNNVHDDAPTIFETRWAMSYLRGPLTRNQIKLLLDPLRKIPETPQPANSGPAAVPVHIQTTTTPAVAAGVTVRGKRPVLSPEIREYFIPVRVNQPAGFSLTYQHTLIGAGSLQFTSARAGVNYIKNYFYLAEIRDELPSIDWSTAAELNLKIKDLEQTSGEQAVFSELPAAAMKPKSYEFWKKELKNWLYQNRTLEIQKSPLLKEYSRPEEPERDFVSRLQQKAREQRDEAAYKLRMKYAPKFTALQEQLRRAQANVERERDQARQQQMQAAFSIGASILGGFLGKKSYKGRSAGGNISRSYKESRDVGRAEENVEAIQHKIHQLETDFEAESASLSRIDPLREQLEKITIAPAKTGIAVDLLAPGWIPFWRSPEGKLVQAW